MAMSDARSHFKKESSQEIVVCRLEAATETPAASSSPLPGVRSAGGRDAPLGVRLFGWDGAKPSRGVRERAVVRRVFRGVASTAGPDGAHDSSAVFNAVPLEGIHLLAPALFAVRRVCRGVDVDEGRELSVRREGLYTDPEGVCDALDGDFRGLMVSVRVSGGVFRDGGADRVRQELVRYDARDRVVNVVDKASDASEKVVAAEVCRVEVGRDFRGRDGLDSDEGVD